MGEEGPCLRRWSVILVKVTCDGGTEKIRYYYDGDYTVAKVSRDWVNTGSGEEGDL